MKSSRKNIILVIIGVVLICIALLYFFVGFSVATPYIENNSIIYHLDENGIVTSIDVTIKNSSFKSYNEESLILRYCDENNYHEGYSSPIVFSVMPFETKTITIDNFRNDWSYNTNYHLEIDANSSGNILINNQNFDPTVLTIVLICILIIIASFLIIPSTIKFKKNSK